MYKQISFIIILIFLLSFISCKTDSNNEIYSVTYDGNGNTGGEVPVTGKKFEESEILTIEGNTGSLVKTDYCFGGWAENTDAAEGVFYGGEKFVIQRDTVFYAVWQKEFEVTADKAPDIIKNISNDATIHITGDITDEQLAAISEAIKENTYRNTYKINLDIRYTGLTKIPDNAFSLCRNLGTIRLPAGITEIGDSAFFGSGISSLTLPEGLTTIETNAFSGSSLTSVTLPESLKSIGEFAFSNTHLASITIPSGVEKIGRDFVTSDNELESVIFQAGSKLTDMAPKAITDCDNISSITIPSGIVLIVISGIGYNGVRDPVTGMYSAITLHINGTIAADTFTSVNTAISHCGSGCILDLSKSKNTFIPDSAFKGCIARSVLLPSTLVKIGKEAFSNACFLYITIPSEVQTIDDAAFSECKHLKTITFEQGSKLESIGDNAFAWSKLESVIIPGTDITMGNNAFCGCNVLTSIKCVCSEQEAASWPESWCYTSEYGTSRLDTTVITWEYKI
ncbi:MAG: leucine-rich repeat protein [Treponema sp.]|nr:leucine-rich repeat protein [Treponema sp.]